jgi:hypothetical protein
MMEVKTARAGAIPALPDDSKSLRQSLLNAHSPAPPACPRWAQIRTHALSWSGREGHIGSLCPDALPLTAECPHQ